MDETDSPDFGRLNWPEEGVSASDLDWNMPEEPGGIAAAKGELLGGKSPQQAPEAKGLEGKRVLIAEDEAIVAMGLMDVVEDAGGEAIGPFARVADCLAWLADDLPDIAILDLRLDDGDSLVIAEQLSAKGIPIVFHSGHMVESEWDGASGDVYYCSKPCAASEMRRTLLDSVASA